MKVRSLAWFAIAAQPVFVASWLVAGALEPGYSHADSYVSSLEAHGAEHPWIVMAGLALLGLSVAALAVGLRAVLPPRRASGVAVALFAVVAAGFLVAALAQPTCDDALRSCTTGVHGWSAFVAMLALLATPFALARALWPSATAGAALSAGASGLAYALIASVLYRAGTPDGTVERFELLLAQAWFVIVAIGILYEARPAPRFSAPAPLRPRDFFGSEWTGTGQARAWPYWLWSVAGPTFDVTRTTMWATEDLGLVRDRAVLRNGRVEERLRYVRIVDPTRLHVTSDDMPDGAKIRIDEDGYRIAPYKVLAPIGPIRLILTCHDSAIVERDGTVAYTVRLRWHGLPVARLDFRARPVDTTPAPEKRPAAVTA